MLRGEIDARYGAFRLRSRIELPGAGVHAVFGPSGCGKSLLLRWLAGLERPPGAQLAWGDEVWQDATRWCPPQRRGLGYVAQQPALFPHLSVRDNLEYGYRRSARRGVEPARVIEALGLDALFAQPVQSLSGGQRQRLAIGRALLCSPRLLLLDEPLSALDRPARLGILRDLRRLQSELGTPMLFVSHSAEEVERLADFVLCMRAGELGSPRPLAAVCADAGLDAEAGAINILDALPLRYSEDDALAELGCGDVRLWLPTACAPRGRVRLRIAARELGLARDLPAQTSYQNILVARVLRIDEVDRARCLVRCRTAGGVPLAAEITQRSRRSLAIELGQAVQLLVKSAALFD